MTAQLTLVGRAAPWQLSENADTTESSEYRVDHNRSLLFRGLWEQREAILAR